MGDEPEGVFIGIFERFIRYESYKSEDWGLEENASQSPASFH
jgi:hypothetical protein